MKILLIFLTLLTLSSLYAEDLDGEMQKIREASPKERVKLMNDLKRRIAKMNQNERSDAINKLRSQIKGRVKSRQDVAKQQFSNTHESLNNQRSNQHQAGSQYINTKNSFPLDLPRF
jgi:hypothetical protein